MRDETDSIHNYHMSHKISSYHVCNFECCSTEMEDEPVWINYFTSSIKLLLDHERLSNSQLI